MIRPCMVQGERHSGDTQTAGVFHWPANIYPYVGLLTNAAAATSAASLIYCGGSASVAISASGVRNEVDNLR